MLDGCPDNGVYLPSSCEKETTLAAVRCTFLWTPSNSHLFVCVCEMTYIFFRDCFVVYLPKYVCAFMDVCAFMEPQNVFFWKGATQDLTNRLFAPVS